MLLSSKKIPVISFTRRFVAIAMLSSFAYAADLPYVNWENHPIHALDLSPDRKTLAVAHTADQRVQLFDVSSGAAIPIGNVLVGIDPVSVRFRNNSELWAVNHISDSVSVIDLPSRQIRATLHTSDEPFDVVFAAGKAFVSCSQANEIAVFDLADLSQAPRNIAIQAQDPRALAVSPDGKTVYAAIFESGNATTALFGGFSRSDPRLPNVVNDVRGPYGGVNPPPNAGTIFNPLVNPVAVPPKVSLIVRRDANRRWMDDNQRDWTRFVSGDLAGASGRVRGWDVVDRDIAVIDTANLSVRYVTGLMNIGMALSVKPNDGELTLIGTDATNEIRYEPNLKARFVKVEMARVSAANALAGNSSGNTGGNSVVDLNPHLNYAVQTAPQSARDQSIGDPRAVVWRGDGQLAWIAGLGSNNVIAIDALGRRIGAPIRTGAGPVGLALDEAKARLFVWNHFDASLSVIDTAQLTEIARVPVFNPLPQVIRNGRAFLYDTQRTSGLGQASCASCHVDARMDQLGWDLGDPSLPPTAFDQNCATSLIAPCTSYHAMKGPMTTQTMQDIIGHEPLHWRGDKRGIEAFNPAFVDLLGDDAPLTAPDMAAFKAFLASIIFPPNPYRGIDNSLPEALALTGQRTSGRFSMVGLPLGVGNAKRGLQLYSNSFLDSQFQCASCHTLPTGMAVNGPIRSPILNFSVGMGSLPIGPMGENHLGVVSTDGFTNVSIKVPQTRNMHEKVGMEFTSTESLSGFGFAHDGAVDSLANFFSASLFSPRSDQDIADLVALNMAFSGSEFGDANPALSAPAPLSKDSHAAVGVQVTVSATSPPVQANQLLALARAQKIDLVAVQGRQSYAFNAASDKFMGDAGQTPLSSAQLLALATAQVPQTWTALPSGLAQRIGVDRDGDGVSNAVEIAQGSNPADATSKQIQPTQGMWFNPARSGHGFDVQFVDSTLFVTWFTYQDDGTPTWYVAVGAYARPWSAPMSRFVWDPAAQRAVESRIGQLSLNFTDAQNGQVDWQIGSRRGSEPLQPLLTAATPVLDRTGNWYDPTQPGWGLGIYTVGDLLFNVAYFYDSANQPRWVVGTSNNTDSAVVAMQSARGFCPDCAHQALVLSPGGEVRYQFNGTRMATARVDVFDAATPNAHWLRGPAPITPLSTPVLHPEQF